MASRGPNTVSVIDTFGKTVVANVPVDLNPSRLAVTPAGNQVYVPNQGDGTVSVIDTAGGNVVTATGALGLGPVGMGECIMPALAPPVLGKGALVCQAAIGASARKFALAGSATTARELALCVLDGHVARVARMVAAEYNGPCPMLTAIGLGAAFPTVCTGP